MSILSLLKSTYIIDSIPKQIFLVTQNPQHTLFSPILRGGLFLEFRKTNIDNTTIIIKEIISSFLFEEEKFVIFSSLTLVGRSG